MIRFYLFLHLLGFTMWLGGGMASMVASIAAKREDRRGLGAVVRAQSALQRAVIAPGALLTVLSGLLLTLGAGRSEIAGANIWLIIMQAAGLIAALLTLFIAVPTAARLGRLDPEASPGAFDEMRQRLRLIATFSGLLGLAALLSGAMVRYGG
jgi:Predicted integral membrane protein (DUF2269)